MVDGNDALFQSIGNILGPPLSNGTSGYFFVDISPIITLHDLRRCASFL